MLFVAVLIISSIIREKMLLFVEISKGNFPLKIIPALVTKVLGLIIFKKINNGLNNKQSTHQAR